MKILVKYKENARRLDLNFSSVESLKTKISEELGLGENLELIIKIFDENFNDYCELDEINEVKEFSKLLIQTVGEPSENQNILTTPSHSKSGNSTNKTPLREVSWNPCTLKMKLEDFSNTARLLLITAMKEFEQENKLYEAPFSVKKEIKNMMASILLKHTFYPSKDQYVDICKALIRDFPCLREPIGTGYSGWQCALRYKIEDERRKEKNTTKEIQNNSGKRSINQPNQPAPNKKVKKPKRGEINFLPNMIIDKDDLLAIKQKMKEDVDLDMEMCLEETYSLRREEILENPTLALFRSSWPTLFTPEQLFIEVKRITNVNINEEFDRNFKRMTPHLSEIMRIKETEDNETEVLLKLTEFFKEKWSFIRNEVKEADFDDTQQNATASVMACIKQDKSCEIVGEGVVLLDNLNSVKEGIKCLMAIYYVCNIDYPKKGLNSMTFLQYTCGIRGGNIPQKAINLISKLERKINNTH